MSVLWILATLSGAVLTMFLVVPLKPQYISSLFKEAVQESRFVLGGFALLELYSKTSAAMVDSMDGFHILVTIYVATRCMNALRLSSSQVEK